MFPDIEKRALHRARILEGQLRSLNELQVENHLRARVSETFDEGGERREAAAAEQLNVVELKNNRGE